MIMAARSGRPRFWSCTFLVRCASCIGASNKPVIGFDDACWLAEAVQRHRAISEGEEWSDAKDRHMHFLRSRNVFPVTIDSPHEPPEPQLIRHPRPDHMFWSAGEIQVEWRSQIFITSRRSK